MPSFSFPTSSFSLLAVVFTALLSTHQTVKTLNTMLTIQLPARTKAASPNAAPQHQNVQQASTMCPTNDWISGGSGAEVLSITTEVCCWAAGWGAAVDNVSMPSGGPHSTLTSLGFIPLAVISYQQTNYRTHKWLLITTRVFNFFFSVKSVIT